MMKPISVIQADIIFKALYYTASREGAEIPDELTEIFVVLAEDDPFDTNVSDTVDVMEYLSEFIKNSSEYSPYFIPEEDSNDYDDDNEIRWYERVTRKNKQGSYERKKDLYWM